ncbi:type VI secretion system membrane subunit TssM [Entomohabitans teleogrylli]|uniref:type VI secretion system membrane subunit TssM n=1 Tax=Entomohabitans teleogrylli TaxID=1384589 RepID=UPI00073D699D|nr:type VI secretion system membrane subunit TssM [Entomohabitans teleogrylli]
MIGRLFSLITHRLLWGFLGILALAFIVWHIGPLLAVGDYRPLEQESQRMIAIAIILLIWILFRLVPRLYSAWFNSRLLSQLRAAPPLPDSASPDLAPQDQQLTQRFHDAAQLLKKARFTPGQKAPGRWAARFNSQYLYQLPWYAIIGAPGAGKTTALANSGLQFPLADHFGNAALRGVGGTRDCDWWFTSDAVLLDTAGRYTTQESQRQQDADEWRHFIALLKKYRARQPLNGVIITISASDLLSDDDAQLASQATALRKRLGELNEQLGISFPVYVLVTKLDRLTGFMDYFARLDKAGREQVWGFTFAHQQTLEADFQPEQAFAREYSLLAQRLNDQLPERLLNEHDARQRAECYLFPQQFAALRPRLGDYLKTVFSASRFDTRIIPRGVYFTSATQEGLPFDQVMGELRRYLQIEPVPHTAPETGREPLLADGRGKSFFLREPLEGVIFKEAGLAGSNRWWEYRHRALHIAGYLALATAFAALSGLWLVSYGNNRAWLDDIHHRLATIERPPPAVTDQRDILALLPFLATLQQITDSEQFTPSSPSLTWRMGLYRGSQINDASVALYHSALKALLLPGVARLVENTLRNDNHSDADFSYEALKAYLMLYQARHYEGKFLRAWVMLNVQRALPPGTSRAQLQDLEQHLSQLLDNQIQTSPWGRDDALIAATRQIINRAAPAQRIYRRLKRTLSSQQDSRAVNTITLAGPQAGLAFARRSGKPLSEGIPALFTAHGYWNLFNQNIHPVSAALRDEDQWVLNNPPVEQQNGELDKTIRQLYMEDFIQAWDELLNDLQLVGIDSLEQRITSARLLSGSASPLRNLVVNSAAGITLYDPQGRDARSLFEQTSERINQSASRTLEALFAPRAPQADGDLSAQPEQVVMNHFAALLELARSADPGQSNAAIPFDATLKQVDELYHYLMAVQGAANSGIPVPPGDIIPRLQAESGRLPAPLRQMLSQLAVGASGDARRKEMENIKKRIGFEVGNFCRQAIAGRYPLAARAQQEITPDDLARMFAPGSGLMDSFFRDNLQGKVDTTRASWRFTPGVDGKTLADGDNILRPFQQAQRIRNAFFASGTATPSYRLTVRPVRMDNSILAMTLDVDGQLFRYSHGPHVPLVISWPGTRNTHQVHLQLALANGASASLSTSGPWALNRLIDMAQRASPGDALRQQATFNLDGHRVTLEFTANSIHNPFQLPAFHCP